MRLPPEKEIARLVAAALAEDVGHGDVTTLATVSESSISSANMVAREELVVAGMDVARKTFEMVSTDLKVEIVVSDGTHVRKGAALLRVTGTTHALLTGERVALNFAQRLSGIATLTAQFVEAVKGTRTKILDTRKTTPGLRLLEKYAVTCGGGQNHRIGLFDMILIKDNHLFALRNEQPNPIEAAVRRARERFPQLKVEVEADTLEQVAHATNAGADVILLDNMTLDEMRAAVSSVKGRAKTEASGGVNLQTVRAIAETGVDFISVGAITHSARAVDIGLDFES